MEPENTKSALDLIDFIHRNPSCYHVVSDVKHILADASFIELDEKKPFDIKPGNKYFVSRNGSALCAFTIPKTPRSIKIIASHTDSPSFKLKENPETGSDFTAINVEAYGGMIMSSWFDRPLSVAGRAFVKEASDIVQRNVDIDKDLCSIVNLCIHQNREINKGHEYKVQKELMPVIAQGFHKGILRNLVSEAIGVSEEEILDTELFLYNREEGRIWGYNNEFFSSPRIDDLECVWCSVQALLKTGRSDSIQMITLFDNEEVGSLTKQGANGDFMSQTIRRICCCLNIDYDHQCALQANSFMLSADNGHSLHPNYPEMCDITNRPLLNKGILIKFAGNQKYTTDGYCSAVLREILTKADVPYQVFFNNSNVSGSSTLGNISQSQYSIPAVDIGTAQLAMHSCYETAGTKDVSYLTSGMTAFLNS